MVYGLQTSNVNQQSVLGVIMDSNPSSIKILLPPRSHVGRTLVHPKLWFEWAADGRIAVLEVVTFDNQAIDAWAAGMDTLHALATVDEPSLILHIATKVRFTPYLRLRADETIRNWAEIPGAYAFVLGDRVFGQIIRLFLTSSPEVLSSQRPGRAFTDRDEAIAWLLSYSR